MKRRPVTFADLVRSLDDRSVEVIRGLADGRYANTAAILILSRCLDYDVSEILQAVQSDADDRFDEERPGAMEFAPTLH